MSGAAKAFVVINLVLAVFFASATAMNLALRTDLKGQLEDCRAKYDKDTMERDNRISQLEQTGQNLERQVDALTNEKEVLTNDLNQTRAELTLERQNRAQLDARLTGLENSYNALKNTHERVVASEQALKNELAASKKVAEDAVAAMELAVDKRREAEAAAEAIQGQMRTMAKDLKEVTDTLARYMAVYPEPGVRYTPADIYGRITQVDPTVGMVVISVGEDDGVKAGMAFTVFRGDGYVGRVIVTKVDKDFSLARVDSSVTTKDVKVNDNVTAAF